MVCMDIGSKNIHIVQGRVKGDKIFIKKAVQIPTPPDCVADGKIKNQDILKDAIKKALSENKIRREKMVITLHSFSVLSRELMLPFSKPEEIKSMVAFEMEQFISADIESYVLEHKLIEEIFEDNVKKLRISVAAMQKGIVESYYELIRQLKCKPIALDIHSNAISKLFKDSFEINELLYDANKTVAVIEVGYTNTYINVMSKGKLKFNRTVSTGGNYFFDIDDKKALNEWISEVQKVFQYYRNRKSEGNIETIYIHGGASSLKELPDYINSVLGIKTIRVNSISKVEHKEVFKEDGVVSYINAIGAMIRN